MPPGGDGFYYFSVYLQVVGDITANFDIVLNGQVICTVRSDMSMSSSNDSELTSCSGVAFAVEGILDFISIF